MDSKKIHGLDSKCQGIFFGGEGGGTHLWRLELTPNSELRNYSWKGSGIN